MARGVDNNVGYRSGEQTLNNTCFFAGGVCGIAIGQVIWKLVLARLQ